jgi:O-antigen/teichoic acid export membrane protein
VGAPGHTAKLLLTIAIIAVGLIGRSAVDKVLALRGGGELVALWAQLFSVIEIVSGVALSGVAAGLSVLVAQTAPPERQALLLWRALRLGLIVGLPVALAVVAAGSFFPEVLPRWILALAALCGWLAIVHGTVNSYWLGQQRRDLMLALAAGSAALGVVAVLAAPRTLTLEILAVSSALPAVVLLFVARPGGTPPREHDRALERYLVPGLAIGILSPVSMLAARGFVADAMSWQEAGVLQALWRISDWVGYLAAGVLSVLYLPRLAATWPGADFRRTLMAALRAVLLPSVVLFVVLFALHRPLLVLLYDASFEVSSGTVALIFAGSVARIAAWVPLFALYAMRRTRAITFGELLSLPLFAILVGAAGASLTLELAAVFWLVAYLVYGAFNAWAMLRR